MPLRGPRGWGTPSSPPFGGAPVPATIRAPRVRCGGFSCRRTSTPAVDLEQENRVRPRRPGPGSISTASRSSHPWIEFLISASSGLAFADLGQDSTTPPRNDPRADQRGWRAGGGKARSTGIRRGDAGLHGLGQGAAPATIPGIGRFGEKQSRGRGPGALSIRGLEGGADSRVYATGCGLQLARWALPARRPPARNCGQALPAAAARTALPLSVFRNATRRKAGSGFPPHRRGETASRALRRPGTTASPACHSPNHRTSASTTSFAMIPNIGFPLLLVLFVSAFPLKATRVISRVVHLQWAWGTRNR
jgi:hypothetical protein